MERDFRYLKDKYGDAGARDVFEKICSTLLQRMYGSEAHPIKAYPGDEGIDILIGDFSSPIEVYQCKYFIDGINDTQKTQIRDSFNTALNSKEYQMKTWTLCIPSTMTTKEFSWWSNWKNKNSKLSGVTIKLFDGSFLLTNLKKHDLFDEVFDEDIRQLLNEISESFLTRKNKLINEIIQLPDSTDNLYEDLLFIKKLEMANIDDIELCKNEFFNAEYVEQVIKSKGNDDQISAFEKTRQKIESLWQTQYRQYKSDSDGNLLLAKTYERIEDKDTSTLDCASIIPEVSLITKKGMLHQLAEECSVGWLQDYKYKLESMLHEDNSYEFDIM